jgi:hypothetical protein
VINHRKESSSQGNNLNHNIDDRFVSQESDSLVYAQIMQPATGQIMEQKKGLLKGMKFKGGP